jgi:hypothetical protein
MQHLRKVQGANLYMTNNMLQSKINKKCKHLPPNNWDLLNDDNVLEEYYKKYLQQSYLPQYFGGNVLGHSIYLVFIGAV